MEAVLAIIGVFFVPFAFVLAILWMKHQRDMAMIAAKTPNSQASVDELREQITKLSNTVEGLQDRINHIAIELDGPVRRPLGSSAPVSEVKEEAVLSQAQ